MHKQTCEEWAAPRGSTWYIPPMMHITDYDISSLSSWCAEGDPVVTRVWGGKGKHPFSSVCHPLNPPTQPPAPLGSAWGATLPPIYPGPAIPARGHRRPVFIFSVHCGGDLWACFAFLVFLMLFNKYCPSTQLIPKAKGKSLWPHIICKLSFSLRTDLFRERDLLCIILM